MKPIKLKFTAFGPYPKTQIVDFTDLKNSNMFVITGPTGSGKTTIFDAISFALYGSASGSERGAEMFRSDFAADTDQTEVEFEFEVRNKRYTINRIPSQYRPKLRGEGMRKIDASVSLTTENSVYTSQSEVIEQIETIIGLTKDQFKQIVLLPQGEFKKLLVSDSRSKEEIFRKIFNTSDIKRIQEQMRLETQELKRKIEDAELQLTTILSSYSNITSSIGLKRFESNINTNLKDTQEHTASLQTEITTFTETLKLEADYQLMDKQLTDYRNRLNELNSNRSKYQLKRDFINNLKSTIEYNNCKRDHKAITEKGTGNSKRLESLKLRLTNLRESDIESRFNQAQKDFDNLEKKQGIKNSLEKKLDAIKVVKQKQQAIDSYVNQIETTNTNLIKQQEIKNGLEKKLEEIKVNITNIESLKLELQQLQLQKQKLEKLTQVVAEIKAIDDKLQKSYTQAQGLNDQYTIANTHLVSIRAEYFSAQAGNLAKNLNDNEPCPVCGSLEHPTPAIPSNQLIDLEEINKQEQLVSDLNSELSSITSFIDVNKALTKQLISEYQIEDIDYSKEYKNICSKLSGLELSINKLSANSNQEVIIEQLTACELLISTLTADVKGYVFTIDKLKTELISSDQERLDEEAILQELTEVTSAITTITTNYKQLQEQFNTEVREKDNIETNIKFIKQTIATDNKHLIELEESISSLNTNYGQEQLNQYSSMLDNEAQIRQELGEYEKNVQLVKQKISELEDIIKKHEPIDVSAIQAKLSLLQNEHNQFKAIEENYKILSSKVKDDLEQLLKIESKSKIDINRYRVIADASDIANGKTISKISFERYMLSIYFKQIITRANIYFKRMTNNRFLLEYKEPHGGRAAQGLDLNIIDNYTSKIRDVKSLSGGESFKAALAMALGLSDIVQMNAGGVQIDTIFIDEGFGSLDSDSLNAVIDTLIEIENEGRIVGIISHVEELKNQISNKIEIEPSPSGSNLKVNFS